MHVAHLDLDNWINPRIPETNCQATLDISKCKTRSRKVLELDTVGCPQCRTTPKSLDTSRTQKKETVKRHFRRYENWNHPKALWPSENQKKMSTLYSLKKHSPLGHPSVVCSWVLQQMISGRSFMVNKPLGFDWHCKGRRIINDKAFVSADKTNKTNLDISLCRQCMCEKIFHVSKLLLELISRLALL